MAMTTRTGSLAALGVMLCFAAPASAEGKGSDSNKDEAGKAEKDEGDVVLDNRDLSKKRREEREQEQKEDPTFASDNPFADSAPDVVALREQRWKPGFGGAYRLGFAFPMGEHEKGQYLGDVTNGLIFLWGDFGYWPIPYLFVGLYGSGGYVLPECPDGYSCTSFELRGGLEVIARVLPFENLSPFVGVGAGYEWWKFKASTAAASGSVSYKGFELLNAQAGLDVRSRGDRYGVFLTYSIGKFSSTDSGSIDEPANHSWFGIGALGTLE